MAPPHRAAAGPETTDQGNPMKTAITALSMTIGLLFAASAQAASPVMPSALQMTSVSAAAGKVKPAKRAKKTNKVRKAKPAMQ
jgi:hypothetical protein